MNKRKKNNKFRCTKVIKHKTLYPTLKECKWVGDMLCRRNPRLFEIATTSSIRAEVIQGIITIWIGTRGAKL